MTISAEIVADSVSSEGIRLTTVQCMYPKFIHGEVMTHRRFSRNASSSRAIPVERMIEDIERDTAVPVFWGKNQPGMQARVELTDEEKRLAKIAWTVSRDNSIATARWMHRIGAHKQITNRILEPYMHIRTLITSTNWGNFMALRRHADAQPEIKALADCIHAAMEASDPNPVERGQWHLPYVLEEDRLGCRITDLIQISVARCARVSYLTHDGKPTTIAEDMALYDRLVRNHPIHASPAEHQATPDVKFVTDGSWCNPNDHGNLVGWRQYRKYLPLECLD